MSLHLSMPSPPLGNSASLSDTFKRPQSRVPFTVTEAVPIWWVRETGQGEPHL